MASKTLLAFGVLLAAILLVSSEVAARELVEETHEKETEAGIQDQKYDGYHGGSHHGGGHHRGGRGRPGHGYPGHGNPGHGRCHHGCCRRGHYGGCRCCSHPDEIPDSEYRPELQN